MAIKVLIVDDSTFFRKRLTEIIQGDPAFEVVGEAKDGKEGVEMTMSLKPDVITMDVEMPVMDGITAVQEIMNKCPTPILMFSSLTFEGANSTFKALEAGAVDFMPKNFDDIAHRREDALNALRSNIKAVARSHIRRAPLSRPAASASSAGTAARPGALGSATSATARTSTLGTARPGLSSAGTTSTLSKPASATPASGTFTSAAAAASPRVKDDFDKIYSSISSVNQGRPAAAIQFSFGAAKGVSTNFKVSGKSHDLVAIGSSTGGPVALQNIIPKLPRLDVPVIIVQHMPASFTSTFAQRLNGMSQNEVVEAQDNMVLEPGHVYIAPGGRQMILDRGAGKTRTRILPADPRVVYHPCVDVTFASIANIYGGKVLSMILTGMGSDGCEGCRMLRGKGGVVWAQNEDTCVVYGMPQAVVNAGLADQILPLDKFADCIVQEMRR
ncbi:MULTISPECIES: chemotaxis response regulator protein-glutamate methylesterase [unclassified Anaerobiospirillum]|uniref:protein-glutamate methylesterase/protein-glutamine glutaminase n=1 Tax=unclassified Anaerobiospirillum TaxID=2647410 RepID=UPI001FF21D68|nr:MULTISPECIES: chemotaxis response regulator protein-glutamate methylesterase [unclassified Anaerobiospirillum]MCK0535236.1 chemotaxis response regulator protein-glutamate methylesterase [Anaerobiospirillum sp. NML120511]MCK0540409.1 chemotaxis response regulator protein-glutamate methylesterase [Anaerobiospirillum sp. NML02-A-032]